MHKTAVILAGGASRRFGSDKLVAPLNRIPLIEHVVCALRPLHDTLLIAGPTAKFAYLGLPVIEDRLPFQGPLHALEGLWNAVTCDKLLLAAGDMPLFDSDMTAMLWEKSKGYDLTWIEGPHGLSPLPGIYSRRSQAAAASLIQSRKFSLKGLTACDLRLRVIPWKEFTACDPAGHSLCNINDELTLAAFEGRINGRKADH